MAGPINIHRHVEQHAPFGKIKKGALHSELHMKQGQKIPAAKLEREKAIAKRTGNVTLEKRVTFALSARKFHH